MTVQQKASAKAEMPQRDNLIVQYGVLDFILINREIKRRREWTLKQHKVRFMHCWQHMKLPVLKLSTSFIHINRVVINRLYSLNSKLDLH